MAGEQKTERAQFLIDNLNLPKASGIETAVWEDFQLRHLNNDALFGIESKSRQIAWSFTAAAEAVADAILEKRDSIFSSINLEEAKEKIRYAETIYENLEIGNLPRLVTCNALNLEFDNGARLTSFPAKPVRGRPKSNWYGDEFAHVPRDRQIYKGSFAIISKGGRVRLGSSPMGASGLFWEIFTEAVKTYPGFTRKTTPWWEIRYFCIDVKTARQAAPLMATFERVEQFGTDRLKAIFANVPLEDFQQEYECAFVDESTAWITWDEIRAAEAQGTGLECRLAAGKSESLETVFEAIFELARLVHEGKIENVLAVGMDIGRTRHTTEIFAVGCSNAGSYPLRLALTLDGCTFDQQFAVLSKVLEFLPIKKAFIDRGGLGMNLAENAARRFPAKAEGVNFTQQSKQLWATDAKMLIQQGKTPLPVETDLAYQIHSIKRIVTPSKNVLFDTVRNEKHHADKFWAWALAIAAAGSQPRTIEDDFEDTASEHWG